MERGADQTLDPADYMGRRTLIVGEVNSGKTTLTRKILDDMCDAGLAGRILVLDMAPEIPEDVAQRKGLRGVGGFLVARPETNILLRRVRTIPPRLLASSEREAVAMAERNRQDIDRAIEEIDRLGRDVLFVNDVSLYLQAGSAKRLIAYLSRAETAVVNGYYGERLGQGVLSRSERAEMDALMGFFDRVIRL